MSPRASGPRRHLRSAPAASSPRRSRAPGRLIALFVILFLSFGGMAARLVSLQLIQGAEFRAIASQYREREIVFPAHRGAIFDREGRQLAISVDLQSVYADPSQIDRPRVTARKLERVLDVSRRSIRKTLADALPGSRFEYLQRQVDPAVAEQVEALALPGIGLQVEPKRLYPGRKLAGHVLGYVNAYGDALGGVEVQYDHILKGRPGSMTLEQDPTGRALPQTEFSFERAIPGRSLYLTIDKDVQYFTELTLTKAAQEYGAEAATAIVLLPRTGEIIAMANYPDFDPNHFNRYEDEVRRNRAITDNFEPGSSFKLVTLVAALEEGVVKPHTTLEVPDQIQVADRVISDSHSHAVESMTVGEIIGQSSNVGTIKLGLQVGAENLDRWIRRFGFGRKTGLDYPGEGTGIVLELDEWWGSTIGTVPMGQGIAVTPLQLVMAYGAVANKGLLVEPKLVHAMLNPDGETVASPAAGRRRILSKKTARRTLEILEDVVADGTGLEAQIPGYRVGGKTGTAQKPLPTGGYGNSYIASFAGIAPIDDPEIVVLVTFDEPDPIWGGQTAAPTFKQIAEFTLRHLGVAPSGNAERAARDIEEEQETEPAPHD